MKTKFIYSSILLVIAMGTFLGFSISDNIHGARPNSSDLSKVIVQQQQDNGGYHSVNATVIYNDACDGTNDTTSLKARGYKPYYRGTGAQGLTATWFQGDGTTIPSFNGPATGCIFANYNVVTGTNNIDSWLVLPRVAGGLQATDSLYFYERTTAASIYPDSIRVMYSANDSTPEGTWTELGRMVADLSGSYSKKGFKATSASANGRFAIRYNVVNGGPAGANSNIISVDQISIVRTDAPVVLPSVWYEQTSGLTTQLTSVSAPDINNVWACGYAGKVIRTTNGGTWISASGNLGVADIYSVYAFDANNALVTTSPGGTFVYRTSNGGTNWTQVYTDANASAFIDSWYFKDANNGLMIADGYGGRSKVYKTTNAGTTWDTTGAGNFASTDGSYNNAIFGSGDVVYWGTAASKFYKSTNFGTSWAPLTATGNTNTFSFWFNDANNGFIGGTILQNTTNGGTTLTTSTVAGTGSFSGTVGTTAGNYWTARGTSVYVTANSGTLWTLSHLGAGGTYNHMTEARTGSPYLYAVTSTGGISKFGGLATGVTPVSNVVDNYSLSQNYPNPFNPTTSIQFAIPTSGFVTLKVYNMLGKEVATLVNGNLNAGNHSFNFNASNLASGVYFYKLESANFSDVKKMSLIK